MGSTMHATQSELQAAKVDLAYRGRGVSTLRQFASVQAPLQDTQNGPYNQPDTPGSANPSLTRIWSRNHSSSDTPAVTPARACDPARGLLRAPADPAQHVPQERVLPAVEVRARAPRVREVPVQRVSAPLIFSPRPRPKLHNPGKPSSALTPSRAERVPSPSPDVVHPPFHSLSNRGRYMMRVAQQKAATGGH